MSLSQFCGPPVRTTAGILKTIETVARRNNHAASNSRAWADTAQSSIYGAKDSPKTACKKASSL